MISNKFSTLLGERLVKISRVSNDTGISRTTLTGLYYRRSKGISFEVLDTLCRHLGCTVCDILEYKPDELQAPEAQQQAEIDEGGDRCTN